MVGMKPAEYAMQLGREYPISEYLAWGGFPAAIEISDIESR